ncbi:MAG: pentapeptide repeat-containing protein, partial [Anaerolineales bacterium]
TKASLVRADLSSADLSETDLQDADFSEAIFANADLSQASLVRTNLDKADLTGCRVYGCSVWDVHGQPAAQHDLLISHKDDGDITTDDIEVAQFIYLMYDNRKIRNVINSITSKGVLILGRFSPPERKVVLDGLRDKLREFNLLPIVFDFDRPTDKDYTETVQTLAGMSLFVIADITSPKSTPLELEATVKQFKIPFLPIIDTSTDPHPFAMLVDLQKNFHWVLQTLEYDSKERLLENVKIAIIDRALAKHNELRVQKAREPQTLTIDDLLRGNS